VTLEELIPGEPAALLQRHRKQTRQQAIKLWVLIVTSVVVTVPSVAVVLHDEDLCPATDFSP